MKTLTSGCENVPAWCTWMTYPICWGHSWWSYPYPLVFHGIRLTQEPACRHSFISWPCWIEKSRFFLLNNQTSKCQRISLAFLTRYGRVMPSTYHEVIRLCIHEKKLSFMTSQVCVCVGVLFQSHSTQWMIQHTGDSDHVHSPPARESSLHQTERLPPDAETQ